MKNILSIDLECWTHFYRDAVCERKKFINDKIPDKNYIEFCVDKILDLLKKYNQKATFFVIAELYDLNPKIIEKILENGHEIGFHGFDHKILKNEEVLIEQFKKSEAFLKKFTPKGFRAPKIFLTNESAKILQKYGFKYSSSIYADFLKIKKNNIFEIPVTTKKYFLNSKVDSTNYENIYPKNLTFKIFAREIPIGSGLFLAVFGKKLRFFIDALNRKNQPIVMFLHNWQLFQTKQIFSFVFKLKVLLKNPLCFFYTRNILKDFEFLLQNYEFTTFEDYFGF